MKKHSGFFLMLMVVSAVGWSLARAQQAQSFTIQQVTSFPYASDLTAATGGTRIAWVLKVRGIRNIYVAEGPAFIARRLTNYAEDDGQELTNLSLPADGKYVVYTRGGDNGGNWPAEGGRQPNPTSSPSEPHVEIHCAAFDGGVPKFLARGDAPVISPKGDRVAFLVDGQITIISIGGNDSTKHLVYAKGTSKSLQWSPSGDKLAFVSDRGDHSFIGVYKQDGSPIMWLGPSTNRDFMPRWSPDGTSIAFVRIHGEGGPPLPMLHPHRDDISFELWTADAGTGQGRRVWKSPDGSRGAYPTSNGEANLHWMAGDRLTFLADLDGWPHLYSISLNGGSPLLLTPGKAMAEFISASPDGRFLVYSSNTGPLKDDLERRHVFAVPVDSPRPVQLTPGEGIEWAPVVTGDGHTVAFIGGTVQQPMLPAIVPMSGGATTCLASETIPADFPATKLITPKAVVFRAPDGLEIHGQLFRSPVTGKRPAIVFVHGGPPRQMLLGWHYMFYYSNAYAVNQYLASRGYTVLSVNYRLGIGYGHEFHHPLNAEMRGASEYQDVLMAGRYLRTLPDVDQDHIGIWGGSYGGFLTAMALAHNSDIFATGVDIHGVHNWIDEWGTQMLKRERYEQPVDLQKALEVAWRSSPMSSVATWRSPVLFIHGDDDRNVRFHQTVDLVQRLRTRGIKYEELVIPDEIHDFLRHASWVRVDSATADWFDRTLSAQSATIGNKVK